MNQRLLELFEAQLQRVVINALAGRTLYATATIRQGAHTREVDMCLSEALALAVRIANPSGRLYTQNRENPFDCFSHL